MPRNAAEPPSTRQAVDLRFHGLGRSFGRLRVLHQVEGQVAGGQVLAVTGRNGAGKSTLLRCLAGLVRPQAGEIVCTVGNGRLDAGGRRRAVGYLAPELGFYGELTALENLELLARLRGAEAAAARPLLERLGVPPRRAESALSSGLRQRLRWAAALLHRPPILLLDEPVANLDAQGRRDVMALLAETLDRGAAAVVANPEALDLPRVASSLDLGSSAGTST
ncbi:MAG: ABC transporter ATP-binding protein [Acidobacteriota bacterium]